MASSGPEGKRPAAGSDAVAESLFATLKKELVHTRPWPTRKALTDAVTDWTDNYHNTRRRHSTLNYLTPREHALGYRDIKELAA
jgi:putative transposase